MDQYSTNIVTRRVSRIKSLVPEDINDTLIELDYTSRRKIKSFLGSACERCSRACDCVFVGIQSLVINDAVCVLEIPYEINHYAALLCNEMT